MPQVGLLCCSEAKLTVRRPLALPFNRYIRMSLQARKIVSPLVQEAANAVAGYMEVDLLEYLMDRDYWTAAPQPGYALLIITGMG